MESRLVKLKSNFNNIITIRNTVKNVFDILQMRINKLKLFYAEFIKNRKNDMFIFGLDSFRFQSKLIDIEYDDMKRLFLAINNRMYCEYFKLHKIIVEYILNNIADKKIIDIVKVNTYPTYKDLEPYKDYKFETILDIHESILNLLNILMSSLTSKENELAIHKTKQSIGLNIDNFITTFNFDIVVLREKTSMFITYIDFFHKTHTKYLNRFSNKIQLMYTHINNDINFDEHLDKKGIEIEEKNVDDKQLCEMNSDFSSITMETQSINLHEEVESRSTTPSIANTANKTFVRSRNNSFSDLKRNFKELIKENVSKASNMFQLCKPKNKLIEPKLSSEELNRMFTNIDTSCENVVKENVGLFITEFNELKEVAIEGVEDVKVIEQDTKEDFVTKAVEENVKEPDIVVEEDIFVTEVIVVEQDVVEEALVTVEEIADPGQKKKRKPRKTKN